MANILKDLERTISSAIRRIAAPRFPSIAAKAEAVWVSRRRHRREQNELDAPRADRRAVSCPRCDGTRRRLEVSDGFQSRFACASFYTIPFSSRLRSAHPCLPHGRSGIAGPRQCCPATPPAPAAALSRPLSRHHHPSSPIAAHRPSPRVQRPTSFSLSRCIPAALTGANHAPCNEARRGAATGVPARPPSGAARGSKGSLDLTSPRLYICPQIRERCRSRSTQRPAGEIKGPGEPPQHVRWRA
jgi:hypothetical protein